MSESRSTSYVLSSSLGDRYLVVDLMNGGDLRFHISRKTFTEDAVRFWMAELGCALRYVHQQGIIHRDVKPDNVLLDSEGHVHLADFNVASDFKPDKPLTSKSGTLAYLAPEVYAGKGYLSECDWWSLGVCFYECIYNKRPFDGNNHDALAQAIIKASPLFPQTTPAVSMPCLHAISSLLEKNRKLRIGATSFESFSDNPFFREIDFVALERKEIEPVFRPSSEKTNFDATYDLEELLLEETPLEARTRKQKPRAELREDASRQEIREEELHKMIESLFEPFNYTLLPQDRAPVTESASASPSCLKGSAGNKQDESKNISRSRPEQTRSAATSRSQTPASASRTTSAARSAAGSPPLPATMLPPDDPASKPEHFSELPERTRTLKNEDKSALAGPSRVVRPGGSKRSVSMGGTGLVTEPATSSQGPTVPGTTAKDDVRKSEKATGMLGFLNRKKGRDRSPKGKAKERGVLGKEGARVVTNR